MSFRFFILCSLSLTSFSVACAGLVAGNPCEKNGTCIEERKTYGGSSSGEVSSDAAAFPDVIRDASFIDGASNAVDASVFFDGDVVEPVDAYVPPDVVDPIDAYIPPDVTAPDVTVPVDVYVPPDVTVPVDVYVPPDVTVPVDVYVPPDVTVPVDVYVPPDVTVPVDVYVPPDVTAPVDVYVPPDVTVPVDVYVPPDTGTDSGVLLSPGCGGNAAGTPAGGVSLLTASGRKFQLLVPAAHTGAAPYPILFMFHGIYATGTGFQSWFKMEDYAGSDAIIVYPDAINGFWDLSGQSDITFVNDMITQIGQTYCVDKKKVFGFGFSYGAFFAHHLGCKNTQNIKAIVAGDGHWPGNETGCGQLPVLITHRTEDNDEPISGGRASEQKWSSINQCSSQVDVYDPALNCTTHQNCAPGAPVLFCEDKSINDPTWPAEWKHTVREPYRQQAWNWMKSLP